MGNAVKDFLTLMAVVFIGLIVILTIVPPNK